jgi:sialic acid synthase SpsE
MRKNPARMSSHVLAPIELPSQRKIGDGHPCFVIAEAGSNWRMGNPQRDLAMARTLIEVAAECGCDSIKFQTYKADTVYVPNAGESDYLAVAGMKTPIRAVFEDLQMEYEMLAELRRHCDHCDILFSSTPFSVADAQAVDPHVAFHKIASYEISHTELQTFLAGCGKPIVFSTGAAGWEDVDFAMEHLRSAGAHSLALMQCTAKYPAPLDSLNLRTIATLKARYQVPVGLSDHSRDPVIGPVAAVSVGANLIEKHFTLSNRLPGPDHLFALEPHELKQMVQGIRRCEESLGSTEKIVVDVEQELYAFARRGVQVIEPVRKGEKLVLGKNVAILRPGKQQRGAHPRYLPELLSGVANREMGIGEGVQLTDVDREDRPGLPQQVDVGAGRD